MRLTDRRCGSGDWLVDNPGRSSFLRRALVSVFYAVAMAYLDAVVVHLQRALKISPLTLLTLRDPGSLGGLGTIEIGREAATLLMLATLGWLARRSALERMAWTAFAFGIWDLGYYARLWVFIGWPTKLGTFDLLFFLPVAWVAPVWAPMVVRLALIAFGLLAARRLQRGETLRIKPRNVVAPVSGGLVVIISSTLDAPHILDGGTPSSFAWPVFVVGMALAVIGVALLWWSRRNRISIMSDRPSSDR